MIIFGAKKIQLMYKRNALFTNCIRTCNETLITVSINYRHLRFIAIKLKLLAI